MVFVTQIAVIIFDVFSRRVSDIYITAFCFAYLFLKLLDFVFKELGTELFRLKLFL